MATKKEKIAGEISIEVEEVAKESMYLNQHFGNGSLGKTKFDASHILPSMSLLITIGEKRYLVSSQQIITKVIELVEGKKLIVTKKK